MSRLSMSNECSWVRVWLASAYAVDSHGFADSGTFTKFEPGYSGSVVKQNLSHRVVYSDLMIWPRTEILRSKHMENRILISVFRRIPIWYAGDISRILRYPSSGNYLYLPIFFWSVRFNCIVMFPIIPHFTSEDGMESLEFPYHFSPLRALFQNNLSLWYVRVQSAIQFMNSL